MPEYLSPGVYVEELQTGPRPIEGVSTSTAGFVGMTERGPEKAIMVTSWLDFQRWFGTYLPTDVSYLPYAVQGFFDNGGQRLFIARIVPGAIPNNALNGKPPNRASGKFGDLAISAIGRGDDGNRIYVAIEQATQAKTSPNAAGWVKLCILYFSDPPVTKDSVTARAAQSAAQAASDATKAAEASNTAGAAAAADANNAVKAKAFATAAAVAATKADAAEKAANDAKAQADNAAAAAPGNASAQAAQAAAGAVVAAAKQAKTDADAAKTAAETNATNPVPATAGPASQAAQTALTSVQKVVTAATTAAAGPATLVNAARDAQQAAADAATATGYTLADPTNVPKAQAAQTAVNKANDAVKAVKAAADDAKSKADADAAVANASDAAKAAAKAAAQAQKDAITALTDAVAAATAAAADVAGPTAALAKALDDAAKKAAGSAKTAAASADAFAAQASLAAGPQNLAVSPLRPENRKDPGFRSPDAVEVYDNLKLTPGSSNNLEVTVNGASRLVRVKLSPGAGGPNVPLSPKGKGVDGQSEALFAGLTGGSTGVEDRGNPPVSTPLTTPNLADFQGNLDPIDNDPDLVFGMGTGLAALGSIDGISLLAAPDDVTVPTLDIQVINQCELLRDRFGIVSVKENQQGPANISGLQPPQDTSYAAFYYPWMHIYDPASNGYIDIPAAGHITGLIANVDIQRGVHKAPGNEPLRDATDLQFTVTKGDQDVLNPRGVNCIRDFRPSGRGIRVWGARTMSSDPEWKYINVRRLFIFLEQSIYKGTQWAVFEPNDEPLWSQVRRAIGNFLTRVWKSGALMGETAEQAFFVRCDRTTMIQDDIDNGRMVCLIGVAPTKPAEFVIFRISQMTLDAQQ